MPAIAISSGSMEDASENHAGTFIGHGMRLQP